MIREPRRGVATRIEVRRVLVTSVAMFALLMTRANVARGDGDFAQVIKAPRLFDQKRPLDRELQMRVPNGFTFTAVGDLIASRPLSQVARHDAAFGSVLDVLTHSDLVYGNLETTIFDLRGFRGSPYSWAGDWTNSSLPSVAADLKAMGFDVVSRANNHALDWGIEGMRETSSWLDKAGIVYAGVGENRGQARAPEYFESDKGRFGIVSFASTYRPTSDALPTQGATPGRPGLSALAVSLEISIPIASMRDLAHVSCRLYGTSCRNIPQHLDLFGNSFSATSSALTYRYRMDAEDKAEILQSVRDGKQNSDFLVATIHSHECSLGCDDPTKPYLAADFLKVLAHKVIDSGADAFVTTGIHNLGPIEIYKNRPIFYGLGNFFWSDIQPLLPHDLFQQNRALLREAYASTNEVTPYDLTAVLNEASFANDFTFQTVIAQSTFEKQKLKQIRLYAVDLRYGAPLTESGIPRLASPAVAAAIFKRVNDATAQYKLPALHMHVTGSVATVTP
jgi:poly-gamma-glutamate capsule biosynthesis protein CapA/YwtB (metallophosphatase superfamily)